MHEMLFETIDGQRLIVRHKKEEISFDLESNQAENVQKLTFSPYEFTTLLTYIHQEKSRDSVSIVTTKGVSIICNNMDTKNT